jgi:hypothetical protein
MKALTFAEFHKGDFEDIGYQLYFVKVSNLVKSYPSNFNKVS